MGDGKNEWIIENVFNLIFFFAKIRVSPKRKIIYYQLKKYPLPAQPFFKAIHPFPAYNGFGSGGRANF
jgi:hypothetical protein